MGGIQSVDQRESVAQLGYERELGHHNNYQDLENANPPKARKTHYHHMLVLGLIILILLTQVILFFREVSFNDEVAFKSMRYFATMTLSLSGTVTAEKCKVDMGGAIIVAFATAFVGGTIRDVLLGKIPVYWMTDPAEMVIAMCSSGAFYVLYAFWEDKAIPHDDSELLFWFDAFAVSAIAVGAAREGSEALIEAGAPSAAMAVPFAVMVGAAGGWARDLLCARPRDTLRFYAERYAFTAFVASTTMLIMQGFKCDTDVSVFTGFALAVLQFYFMWKYNIQFPRLIGSFGEELVRRLSKASVAEDEHDLDGDDEEFSSLMGGSSSGVQRQRQEQGGAQQNLSTESQISDASSAVEVPGSSVRQ